MWTLIQIYSHFRRRLMFSAFPATDLPCNQSVGFVWLNWFGSNGVLASMTGSPFNLILPDSMAISSLSWTREAICNPHLFLGPSSRQVSVVSQSIPLWGRGEAAPGHNMALYQHFPKTSLRFCCQPKLYMLVLLLFS